MLASVLVLFASAASFTGVAAQTPTIPNIPGGIPSNIPQCVTTCLLRPLLSSGCKISDPAVTDCLCLSKSLSSALQTCIPRQCTAEQVPRIFEVINTSLCGNVTGFTNITAPAFARL